MKYLHVQQDEHKKIGVGKLICLARTYRKHAEEMQTSLPCSPLLFLKPTSAVIFSGDSIIIPKESTCLHHEVELGIVIEKKCKNVNAEEAMEIVLGYLVGLDITARDIQTEAKKNGWPWTIAKGFDTFAPLSNIVGKEMVENPNNLDLMLQVNDEIRQCSNTCKLVWSVEEIISFVSSIMTLERGDVILTGTPEGVDVIGENDVLKGFLSDNGKTLCMIHTMVS